MIYSHQTISNYKNIRYLRAVKVNTGTVFYSRKTKYLLYLTSIYYILNKYFLISEKFSLFTSLNV